MSTLRRLLVGITIALVLTACGTPLDARHVVHISVDGLRSDLLQELIDANQLPNFQRLVREGASTFNARTDFAYSITLPNHTSMLTGRPVLQPAGQPADVHHGYTRNSTPPADVTLHASNPNVAYMASTFDVAHDHGLATALFASKNKFILYKQSWGSKIDCTQITEAARSTDSTLVMHHAFIAALDSAQFDYVFLHYRDPDTAGHDHNWGSAAWTASVRRVDRYLGDLLALIQRNQALRDSTMIILSADHGGEGDDHRDASERHNYTIPFVVWGPDIAAGADLYALNPTRAKPGPSRPDYNAAPQPIRNGDSGNLALGLLGLGPIPGSTINARQDLIVTKEKP